MSAGTGELRWTVGKHVKVCASINTGGGVSMAFDRVELRFKP